MTCMTVIELINKLEQFPPDYSVRFECINNYGGQVEDVDYYPNKTSGCIQLKSANLVRQELEDQLQDVIKHSRIETLRRHIVNLTTRKDK